MSTKRILISPNSFKECVDSVTIAKLIKVNLKTLTNTEMLVKPISDGGDGFLKVCQFYFGGKLIYYPISTAYDESNLDCPVLYCESRKELYVESSEALGLKKIPENLRKPLELSSKGLGELLIKVQDDVEKGRIFIEKVIIGIGGTATIDMGIGMMSKLGLRILDSKEKGISVIPRNYLEVQRIEYSPIKLSFNILSVVDVVNPLLGISGGVQIFGEQKGASQKDIVLIEKGFSNILKVLKNNGLEVSSNQLSGAGGGIPAAFQIFYGSPLISSREFINTNFGLEKISDSIDFLVTGEGAYDYQSNYGKGAGILIELFSPLVEKIFLICGKISDEAIKRLPKNVYPIELTKFFSSASNSIEKYEEGIDNACKEIVKQIKF